MMLDTSPRKIKYRIKTSSPERKEALKLKRQESFKSPVSGDDLRAILFPRRSKLGKWAEPCGSGYRHNGVWRQK